MIESWETLSGRMPYRRSGKSGLHLPMLSVALGHGPQRSASPLRPVVRKAFQLGISAFDITLSSGVGLNLAEEIGFALAPWQARREDFTISARIGLGTRPGPLHGFGSRWQILAGLDGLLRRTGLDYIDVLYMHRRDSGTPLEESTSALADAVKQGKILYPGLSSLAPATVVRANGLLAQLGTPAVAFQGSYSLLDRWAEDGLLDVLNCQGIGSMACAPLAHGLLTSTGVPRSPSGRGGKQPILEALTHIGSSRNQSVEQMAVSWALRDPRVTSALITTTSPQHLTSLHEAVHHTDFTPSELAALDACCPSPASDWAWSALTDI